jgi:hypothetical protein
MKLSPRYLERITLRDFPDAFLKDVTRMVFTAHKSGHELCKREWKDPEAKNIRGFAIRATIEGLLRTTAERHNIAANVLRQQGQPWNHTEVSSGDSVMTAATVDRPGAMVDASDYRKGLAEANPDQLQIPSLSSGNVLDGKRLYVIVAHSKSKWAVPDEQSKFGHLPGSIHLVYPAADLMQYIHHINLMDRYPDIVKQYLPQDWTEEAMVRYLSQTRISAFV